MKKALKLFRKSNPPLLEWLQSPIVYSENYTIAEQIRGISPLSFSPRSCMYHYLHMAKGNFREYLQGDQVRVKKYFYVLRPILACEWIEKHNTMPPIEFDRLVHEFVAKGSELRAVIDDLLARKKAGDEMDDGPRISLINDFLEERIAYVEQTATGMLAADSDQDQRLDELFRSALKAVWGSSGDRGVDGPAAIRYDGS